MHDALPFDVGTSGPSSVNPGGRRSPETAAWTNTPARCFCGVVSTRLLVVRATPVTVTEDLGAVSVPATALEPLRLSCALSTRT
jgi:hypothetical protein